jgi:hypothetical protein
MYIHTLHAWTLKLLSDHCVVILYVLYNVKTAGGDSLLRSSSFCRGALFLLQARLSSARLAVPGRSKESAAD